MTDTHKYATYNILFLYDIIIYYLFTTIWSRSTNMTKRFRVLMTAVVKSRLVLGIYYIIILLLIIDEQ